MLSFGKGTCFNGAYHIFTQDMLSGPLKSRNLEGENCPLQYASSNGLSCVIWKVPGENAPTTSSGSLFCNRIDLIVKCFVKLLLEYVYCTQHWWILKSYHGDTIRLVSHDLFFGWHGMGSPLLLAFSREGSNVGAVPSHPLSLRTCTTLIKEKRLSHGGWLVIPFSILKKSCHMNLNLQRLHVLTSLL